MKIYNKEDLRKEKIFFNEIFEDSTRFCKKINQIEYLNEGEIPIIDQGKNEIAGYSNLKENVYNDIPAIIFGDHTRIIKYIDFPFLIGADGVKILKNRREDFLDKYLYYALKYFKIPNTGYNRHFKWLKEFSMYSLKIEEQKKIVRILDNIQEIIKIKKEQLLQLNELSKSIFIEMFQKNYNIISWEYKKITEVYQIIDGDRGKNYPKSEELFEKEYCLFLNTGNVTKNGFNFEKKVFITKEKDEILKNGKLERNDIVLTTRGTIGNIAYYDNTIEYSNIRINSGMVILRKIKEINPCYFIAFFKEKNTYMKLVSGSAQPQMPISKLKEFKLLLPPIELQNQFAERIKMIEKSKVEGRFFRSVA